jgi:AhpD family alkylhydroperoxidase
VFQQVHSSSLTEPEIQIVLLTDAVANSCPYAVAFHTALALQQGVGSEVTDAIRERQVPTDRRFAALSNLAKTLIEKRGHLSEQELDSFIATGFTEEQVLEVIAIVAASTITNYVGTIANPQLEDPFRQVPGEAKAENETPANLPLVQLCPIRFLTGEDRDGNTIHSRGSSTR